MEIFNGTKLDINAVQTLDKNGRLWVTVIAKGTYGIAAEKGEATLAERQRGLLVRDLFEGEDGLSSPLLECDFVPVKGACDVVVKGSAHAPQGKPVTELDVGLQVGPLQKVVHVVGDRRWIKRLGGHDRTRPEPFVRMPLSHGRAFGGMFEPQAIASSDPADFLAHPANLVGVGHARGKFLRLIHGSAVPNLEAPDTPIEDPEKLYAPVSLGPLARAWSPRREYAGTYDQEWRDEVYPLLPADFDERFYQCAPVDQQIPFPRGGEEVHLLNLTPGGGLTSFRLPDLALPMVILAKTRQVTALTAVVDTLAIDTDDGTFDVVWRARTPLQRSLHEVEAIAAGQICKRWWKSRVFGSDDCGCGGKETSDEDLAPVTEALA